MTAKTQTDAARAELVQIAPGPESTTSRPPVVMDEITTIGRSKGNTVVLDDDLVSRNHALIRREAGYYVLVDLGSANGTFVNDRPISRPTPLNDGDVLRVGDAVFSVRCVPRTDAERRTQPGGATRRVFAGAIIAILVSDVRSYTSLSERIPADNLSALLADWFRRAGQCIEQHAGIIEKFRGDSLMAYWISSKDGDADHITHAINASLALVAASREFDERMVQLDRGSHFRIGCGIHVGEAVLGNIGADARRDFTTLGDCVNVAFRIEAMCSALGREILVSDDARRLAADSFEFHDLGDRALKGKTESMRLFAL